MPAYLPNKQFADAIGHDYPVADHNWHPEEFTFAGLADTLESMAAHDVGFTTVRGLSDTLKTVTDTDLKEIFHGASARTAALTFPVFLSPSHAVDVFEIVKDVERSTRVKMPSVFLFESGAPSYSLDEQKTQAAIQFLSHEGADIGLTLGINPGESAKDAVSRLSETLSHDMAKIERLTGAQHEVVTFRSAGVPAATTQAVAKGLAPLFSKMGLVSPYERGFQNQARVQLVTTSNGVYKNGHPVQSFAQGKKPFAVAQIIPEWFSKTPLWPSERLKVLPEVADNASRVQDEYLEHVKVPMLGAPSTIEAAGAVSKADKRRVFNPQRYVVS